jgi:Lipid A 3-O-deacylase (PagL)
MEILPIELADTPVARLVSATKECLPLPDKIARMASRILLLSLLALLLGKVPVQGQTDIANKPAWIVGGAWQQGSILAHTAKIRHLAGLQPSGWELNLQRQTVGKRYWQQLYRFPRVGVALTYLDYHHLTLGRSLALSPYLSLPLKKGKRDKLHFRFGTGLAAFSNRFYRTENPANNIISATWNAVIQTRLEYEFLLGGKLALLAGAGLNHYSNGGNAKPNLGVNIATASLGLNFYANPNYQTYAREKDQITDPDFFTVSSSLGIKQRNDFDTVKYVVKSLALAISRRVNQKSTLMLGVEGFYDPSLYPRRAWDPRVKPGTEPDIRRVAFNVGHELNLGKLAFGTQVGYYFYRPYKADSALYQRLETRYYLHRFVFIAAGLRLHDVIKADLIEYRLGLRI